MSVTRLFRFGPAPQPLSLAVGAAPGGRVEIPAGGYADVALTEAEHRSKVDLFGAELVKPVNAAKGLSEPSESASGGQVIDGVSIPDGFAVLQRSNWYYITAPDNSTAKVRGRKKLAAFFEERAGGESDGG